MPTVTRGLTDPYTAEEVDRIHALPHKPNPSEQYLAWARMIRYLIVHLGNPAFPLVLLLAQVLVALRLEQ